jgi:UDP-N-acetylmuramoyl-tripeptide--D-alanyl-D-alanine ligase
MSKLFSLFYQTKGVCTDTRSILPDSLFIALKGNNFNGNLFAENAIQNGAKFAIVDQEEFADNVKIFCVQNTLKFLQDLAKYHRAQFNIPVIGITGSNGKTSTKELIYSVLSKKFKTIATRGNLNNHLGVPFTLLRIKEDDEIAIIEMGANQPGDIQELCDIASPTHGIITNIGKAHLEGFGNLEGVVKTKSALYQSIKKQNGVLFFNEDDSLLKSLLDDTTKNISYGKENADITGDLIELNPYICMRWKSSTYTSEDLNTNMVGNYNFYNFLAAICIGDYLGIKEMDISDAVTTYKPENKRSQVLEAKRNTLIVDCYNANPTSMLLALESFRDFDHNKKLAIIGDMLELGQDSVLEHQKIINYCKENKIEFITVGPIFKNLNKERGHQDVSSLSSELSAIHSSAILLKGSRGIELEKLIDHL